MFFWRSSVPKITAEELKQWMDDNKDMILLDVRTEQEWKDTGIIPGSITIPNFKIIREIENGLDLDKNKPVICICRSGQRSKKVAEYLQDRDIEALNLKNGINAWLRNQYKIERL